jgi:Na+-driven multidrug efflux pump
MRVLTQPTRTRLVLWAVLAVLWLLFLPQAFAMDPDHAQFSWPGAIVWAVVLAWLITCLFLTVRYYKKSQKGER